MGIADREIVAFWSLADSNTSKSDLGHIDRQFTAHGTAKAYQTQLEFL